MNRRTFLKSIGGAIVTASVTSAISQDVSAEGVLGESESHDCSEAPIVTGGSSLYIGTSDIPAFYNWTGDTYYTLGTAE